MYAETERAKGRALKGAAVLGFGYVTGGQLIPLTEGANKAFPQQALLPQDPVPMRVNVYMPRDTAFDLAKMAQVTKNVLTRLGCEGCHSGRVIDYHIIEDFVVNAKTLDLIELPVAVRP